MKNKIISFSLWGTTPKYLVGAIRNAELASKIYPGWKVRYYVDALVPINIISQLESFAYVEIIKMNEISGWNKGLYWRLFPAFDENVDAFIVRDTDSRLNKREAGCVEEWLRSDKNVHTIRDHPWHQYIMMPGLSGFKNNSILPMKSLLKEWMAGAEDKYGNDYLFFSERLMPYIKNELLVHDEIFSGQKLLIKRNGLEFCGQVFDENDNTVAEHVFALKNYLEKKNDK